MRSPKPSYKPPTSTSSGKSKGGARKTAHRVQKRPPRASKASPPTTQAAKKQAPQPEQDPNQPPKRAKQKRAKKPKKEKQKRAKKVKKQKVKKKKAKKKKKTKKDPDKLPLAKRWAEFKAEFGRKVKIKLHQVKESLLGRRDKGYTETSYVGKRFLGIIGLFLFYSLIFISFIRSGDNVVFNALVLFHPYVFGVALVETFLSLSIVLSADKIRDFVFKSGKKFYQKSALKQLLVFGGIFAGFFLLTDHLIASGFNFVPVLVILGTLWLVFQSINFYYVSRKFGTKVEKGFVKKYSKIRLFWAVIIPWIIIGILVFVSWIYRFTLVRITLDLLAYANPTGAAGLYGLITNTIMPAIYFTLVLVSVFIVAEFVLTRKRSETKSAGIYDNLTFSLIVLFLFAYLMFQMTLYMSLNPQTVNLFRDMAGSGGSGANFSTTLLFVEFAFSMFFLYRGVRNAARSFGYKMLFFKKDGLITGFLGCILAQSISRYLILAGPASEYGGQTSLFETWLSSGRLFISVLLIAYLGATIIFYYLRPQSSSMFMRIDREAVEEQDRVTELVLKFLRREFIRKGTKFPLEGVVDRLVDITNLPVGVVHSVVHRIADSYVDILLIIEETPDGEEEKWIDFIPITEKYDGDKQSEVKAKSYLQKAFASTVQDQKSEKKRIYIARKRRKDVKDEAIGSLLSSLESSYRRKRKEEIQRVEKKEELKEKVESLEKVEYQEETISILYEILKNEFITRVKQDSEYARVSFTITDVQKRIEQITRISPVDLYPMLELVALQDENIKIIEYNEGKDRLINFLPVSDVEISDAMQLYRPVKFQQVKVELWTRFAEAVRYDRDGCMELVTPGRSDASQSTRGIFFKILLDQFRERYPKRERVRQQRFQDHEPLLKTVNLIARALAKRYDFDQNKNKRIVRNPQK